MRAELASINPDTVIDTLVSSNANIFLTAERLRDKLGVKVTEYDIMEILTSDTVLADDASRKLRFSAQLLVFEMLIVFKNELVSNVDMIGPKDIMRGFGSLLAAFSSLTAPATKANFDFALEAKKAADEFGLPAFAVEEAVKSIVNSYSKQ
jgi:hypothetical protein